MNYNLTIQGHRGCRGLMPENTIIAFEKAIELGVDILEMDVVLTKDHQILVSHDPFMRSNVMEHPNGTAILKEDELDLNIYQMEWEAVCAYKSATGTHPEFPEQKKVESRKPLLKELVSALTLHCDSKGLKFPSLNIEIKSREEWDGVYHPDVPTYAAALKKGLEEIVYPGDITLQSFDIRMISEMRRIAPELPFFYLIEKEEALLKVYFEKLGFKPFGLSPHYSMVTKKLVEQCKTEGIALAVWTVNDKKVALSLVDMGVTSIITDYPNLINKALLSPALVK